METESAENFEILINEDLRVLRAAKILSGAPNFKFEWAERRLLGCSDEQLGTLSSLNRRDNI